MANQRTRHGKVERRRPKQRIRFKFGVAVLLILLAFGICFSLHMRQALTTEHYWQDEIIGSVSSSAEAVPEMTGTAHLHVVNPVPLSERAEDSRLSACAWIGDEPLLTEAFHTASDLYVSDAVSGMSESRRRSIARTCKSSDLQAIYLWFAPPETFAEAFAKHPEETSAKIQQDFIRLAEELLAQMPDMPLYVLSSLPTSGDAAENRNINNWNSIAFAAADAAGMHFVDVSTALKANDGTCSDAFAETSAQYETVKELILTHVCVE